MQFPIGPRLLTLFLYLSDVDGGGETTFNSLNITVAPKKGRALLWPSVKDGALTTPDMRTMHEARPVLEGEKYAAKYAPRRPRPRSQHPEPMVECGAPFPPDTDVVRLCRPRCRQCVAPPVRLQNAAFARMRALTTPALRDYCEITARFSHRKNCRGAVAGGGFAVE